MIIAIGWCRFVTLNQGGNTVTLLTRNTTTQRPSGAQMTSLLETGRHVLERFMPSDFCPELETYKKDVSAAERGACRDFTGVIAHFYATDTADEYFLPGSGKNIHTLHHTMSRAVQNDMRKSNRTTVAKNLTDRIVAAIEACPATEYPIYV